MAERQDSYEPVQAKSQGTSRNGAIDAAVIVPTATSSIQYLAPQLDQQPADAGRSLGRQECSGGDSGYPEEGELDPVEKGWLADLRITHSDFQVIHFIVAQNGITAWGCYQQALREYFARRTEIFKIDKNCPFGFRQWEELAREMMTLAKLCAWYRKQLPEELTDEVKAELEADLAYRRLARQMRCEVMSEKRVSIATLMAIGACPARMRKRLYDEAAVVMRSNPIDFLNDDQMTVRGLRHPESIDDLTPELAEG